MDSIIESNHTCVPLTYDIDAASVVKQRPLLEREVFMINSGDYYKSDETIKQKIRKKVVLALCGVDRGLFDLSYFNDLPLQLMPRVLELLQEHTMHRKIVVRSLPQRLIGHPNQLEIDALSRLFHTVRGWELPLLFENLSPKT